MKTEVYLVRHGETLFNRLNKVQLVRYPLDHQRN